MGYVGLVAPVLGLIQALHSLVRDDFAAGHKLMIGLLTLKDEMEDMERLLAANEEQTLQELSYEIEDFVHSLLIHKGLGRLALRAIGMKPTDNDLAKVNYLKTKAENLKKRLKRAEAGGSMSAASGVASGSSRTNPTTELVGDAKAQFLKLLPAVDDGDLRVISIVGCSGLGKTALARALYDDPAVVKAFPCKAWVVASECTDAEHFLTEILPQIATSHVMNTIEKLCALLQNKRYLVVIDDLLEVQLWNNVKSAFPNTAGSRIIVTTSIQSIANISCKSDRYSMPYLDITSSRKLLRREMNNDKGEPSMDVEVEVEVEERILSKCDGLPLALLSVAQHLRDDPTEDNCIYVAQALGTYIECKPAFRELKKVLAQCYCSLPEYRDRRCLLSVSMFPQGHRIDKKSLLRKWIAEGLIADEGQLYDVNIASNSFNEFVKRGIVHPVMMTAGKKPEIKECQVRGLMLEFIVHKSTCATNFVTLIDRGGRLPTARGINHIRRLVIRDGAETNEEESYLSAIRWLTICNSVPFDFSKCSLLRVLDLEGCSKVDKEVLHRICKLVLLKYLSFRGSDVEKIPRKITELVLLETLDIRETGVKELPMEVIMMPGLVHMFGRFGILPKKERFNDNKEKAVSVKINLQTLAGVVIGKKYVDFQYIMHHAAKLKKVKIWCNSTGTKNLFPKDKLIGREFLDSLSIDSSDEPMDFLSVGLPEPETMEGYCAIRYIKLRGPLKSIDSITKKLERVAELQLSSTALSSQVLSSVLQKMCYLVYLKLTDNRHGSGDDSFVVEPAGFPSLKRLCIQAPRLPKVQVKQGAMPLLTSLELLLCPGTSVQTGATAETTSHQSGTPPTGIAPNESAATSEISSLELESSLRIRTACIKLSHDLMTIANSEITAPLETGMTAEIEGRIGVEGLSNLSKLDEVILHHSTTDAVMEDWKEAVKKHINRPSVKKQPELTNSNIP